MIEYLAHKFGLENKDILSFIIPISIFLSGILINIFVKGLNNHNQRKLTRSLFKINLIKLIRGVNKQAISYDYLQKQIVIDNDNPRSFSSVSIAAISIFQEIRYEDLYKAYFKGIGNYFAFNKKNRLKAFSNFYSALDFLILNHRKSFDEIKVFEDQLHVLQDKRNEALGEVSRIIEDFRFEIHGEKVAKEIGEYFEKIESLIEDYQDKQDYTNPTNTEDYVQALLFLNRNSIDTLKMLENKKHSVLLNAALLESSLRFINLQNYFNSYNSTIKTLSEMFFSQRNVLIKSYRVLFTSRICFRGTACYN